MKIQQRFFSISTGWNTIRNDDFDSVEADLVLVFGDKELLGLANIYEQLRTDYPKAQITMNSTAGEILDVKVNDHSISLTAIKFYKSSVKTAFVAIADYPNSHEAGNALARKIVREELKSLLIISDGQLVNGSDLVSGLESILPQNLIITGGLAGDGSNFQSTLVGLNATPTVGLIIAVGFYGSIKASFGSMGGWDPFGPERLITRSSANILFELDGIPALDLYKKYLGDDAKNLPGSALLYPLSIRLDDQNGSLVRTILNINEEDKSLVFAGNMPEGTYARLMKANFDRLIEGSSHAAQHSMLEESPELAILISCVGRKLVLDQRIEEEIEVVRAVYGEKTAITGFYSYGEISPSFNFASCGLHNQTMTITAISEY